MVTLQDTDIVSALQEDGERGFRLLMTKYKQVVYWHIRRLVVSHDDAQDAAHLVSSRGRILWSNFKRKARWQPGFTG